MLTDALVVEAPGSPFAFRQIIVDEAPRDDEVLVEMTATGLCHTDLNFSKEETIPGLFPAVFGHEGAGIVLKAGPLVTNVSPGDKVLMSYSSCGDCKYCHRRETSYCDSFEKYNFGVGRPDGSVAYSTPSGTVTSHFFGQSSFSKTAIVMASTLIKVDDTLPLNLIAPLGCGVMTGAGAMLNVLQPKSGSIICITGAGSVGLSSLMAVKLLNPPPLKIIAVDILSHRLELAIKYGATAVINSTEVSDLKQALLDASDGLGIDGSIDTTGQPEVVNALLEATAKQGTVVQVGVGLLTAVVSPVMFDTVNTGRIYRGCAMGSCDPLVFIPRLIKAWLDGDFPFTDLIKEYPASEIAHAVEEVSSGAVIKAVLSWS